MIPLVRSSTIGTLAGVLPVFRCSPSGGTGLSILYVDSISNPLMLSKITPFATSHATLLRLNHALIAIKRPKNTLTASLLAKSASKDNILLAKDFHNV